VWSVAPSSCVQTAVIAVAAAATQRTVVLREDIRSVRVHLSTHSTGELAVAAVAALGAAFHHAHARFDAKIPKAIGL